MQRRLALLLIAAGATAFAQGTVTTVIGKARWDLLRGIKATDAPLSSVYGVAPMPDGSIAFSEYSEIHRITPEGVLQPMVGRSIQTQDDGCKIADGSHAGELCTWAPRAMIADAAGNFFFTDALENRVYQATPDGFAYAIAGLRADLLSLFSPRRSGDGGPATLARLASPRGIVIDSKGNLIFAESFAGVLRRIDKRGIISTIYLPQTFSFPEGLAIDAADNLYVTEYIGSRVWKVNPAAATVTLLAGTGLAGYDGDDKAATTARLNFPSGVAVDGAGSVYIADTGNGRIRFIDADGFIRTAISGLRDPGQITFDKAGSLLIGEYTGRRVLRWTPGGDLQTLAGNSALEANGDGGPLATASYAGYGSLSNTGLFPQPPPAPRSMPLRGQGLLAPARDGTLYFSDVCIQPPPRNLTFESQTPCLRQIDPAGNVTRRFQFTFDAIHADGASNLYGFLFGQVARYEGNRTTALPAFFQATGPVAQDASGVFYYSTGAGQVFRLPADVQPNSQGVLVAGRGNTAYSGAGGPATQAGIPGIQSLAADRQGNLYISHVDMVSVGSMVGPALIVSKVSSDGLFTLISSDFAPADQPCKIAIDARDQLVAGCNSPSAGATVYRFVNGRRQVVAGGLGLPETNYQPADGSAASALKLSTIGDMKAGPDGSMYLADVPARKIYRIRLD